MSDVVDIRSRSKPEPIPAPSTPRLGATDRDLIMILNSSLADMARLIRAMGVEASNQARRIDALEREVSELKRK